MSINACAVKYIKPPMCGHRCIARSDTTITLWQKDRPGCMLKCVQLKICHYINYNYDTGQCDLGLDKCESLIPTVGVTLSVFGPARDYCIHWGPRQQHGRVAVELQEHGYVMYLARIRTDDTLLVGKFSPGTGSFWANNAGELVGPVSETDQNMEFLAMDPACTLPLMPYMAGGLLPVGPSMEGFFLMGPSLMSVKWPMMTAWYLVITTPKRNLHTTNITALVRRRPSNYWYCFKYFQPFTHGHTHCTFEWLEYSQQHCWMPLQELLCISHGYWQIVFFLGGSTEKPKNFGLIKRYS